MTTAQEIQRDQQQQAEEFRGELIGYGMLGAAVVFLLVKAWERGEWRRRR